MSNTYDLSFMEDALKEASKVLRADVELVDAELKRVCGTGALSGDADILAGGAVYEKAFADGRFVNVKNPKRHEVCEFCRRKHRCLVAAETAAPVFFKGRVVGAVGILSTRPDDGALITTDVSAAVSVLRILTALIEERLSGEDRLRPLARRDEIFTAMFKGSPNCAILTDADGNVAALTAEAETLFGPETRVKRKLFAETTESGMYAAAIGGRRVVFPMCQVTSFGAEKLYIFFEDRQEPTANEGGEEKETNPSAIRTIGELEREAILHALEVCGETTQGKRLAAEKLGIGVATLYRKLGEIM